MLCAQFPHVLTWCAYHRLITMPAHTGIYGKQALQKLSGGENLFVDFLVDEWFTPRLVTGITVLQAGPAFAGNPVTCHPLQAFSVTWALVSTSLRCSADCCLAAPLLSLLQACGIVCLMLPPLWTSLHYVRTLHRRSSRLAAGKPCFFNWMINAFWL